jgi:hypothetical protein
MQKITVHQELLSIPYLIKIKNLLLMIVAKKLFFREEFNLVKIPLRLAINIITICLDLLYIKYSLRKRNNLFQIIKNKIIIKKRNSLLLNNFIEKEKANF